MRFLRKKEKNSSALFFVKSVAMFSDDLEKDFLQIAITNFKPVQQFLIACRVILCGQESRQVDLVEEYIKNVASNRLLSEFRQYLQGSMEEEILFSYKFQQVFQDTLIAIIRHKQFQNDRVIDLYCDVVDFIYPKLSPLSTVLFLYSTKAGYYDFAQSIPHFFTEDHPAQKILTDKWDRVINYAKNKGNAYKNLFLSLHVLCTVLFVWQLGLIDTFYFGFMLFLPFALILSDGYRWAFPERFLSPSLTEEINNQYTQLLRIKKIEWPVFDTQKVKNSDPKAISRGLELEPIKETALMTHPPSEKKESNANDALTTASTASERQRKKTKTHRGSKESKQEVPERPLETRIGGYHYDPENENSSTAFPIIGSLAAGIFFVGIEQDLVAEDLHQSGLQGKNFEDLFNTFKTKIQSVNMSNSGENLKFIRTIQCPQSGERFLCYELRLLGTHINERLIGFFKSIAIGKGRNVCFIELNTYVASSHTNSDLNRAIDLSLSRSMKSSPSYTQSV